MKSTDHARILIVEDEGMIANHLASRLLVAGYDVTGIAQSAEEALTKIKECAPELILMDIHIKGLMDGIEAAAALRERSDVPVIYLTAHSDQMTVDRAKMTGAAGFLTKPIQYAALGHAIEMALNNHPSGHETRSQRAWMRTVLDTIKDAILVIDGERKVQYLNAAAEAITGWGNEDARGLDVGLILPIAGSQAGLKAGELLPLPGSSQPRRPLPEGLLASKHSGQWFRVEGEVALSVDGEEVVGAVIQFGDATSRHEREMDLRHDNRMREVGRLAAGVAHDFNNLVFIILGYTDELLEMTKPGVPESDALSKIRKAGVNAATLAEQLLTFSRKDSKQKKLVNLSEIIQSEEELVRRLAGPQIELEFRVDQSLDLVWADRGQLQQVLTNLVTNARDAMPAGGSIVIETMNRVVRGKGGHVGETDAYVQLRVTDKGIGMSAETAARLFEPFFTTKKAGKGTGLGLAIVHNIVEGLGGTIQAESRPGRGSVFTICIPRASAHDAADGQCGVGESTGSSDEALSTNRSYEAEPSTSLGEDDTATVLLIEDESGVRRLIRDYLAGSGYKVLEASSGEEGISVANQHRGRIDLLISDRVMPNIGGFEIARMLAQTRPGIKTLFISGYTADFVEDEGQSGSGRPTPGTRLLLKPFPRAEFLKNVRELLAQEVTLSARAHL
jgi:two-component system cell cycle sensor histidine kinase/response regulator CckA